MAYYHPHPQEPPPHHHHSPPHEPPPPQHHHVPQQPPPHHASGPQGQVVKIFCKADKTYNLAIRNHTPVLAPADSKDPIQLWIKDSSHGERIKDNFGFPAFLLVNQGTNQVLKHGKKEGQQLSLVEYQPGFANEDVYFTESQDFGEGFKSLRMASDTLLNVTVYHEPEKKSLFHHSDKSAHQIKEGTPLVLDTWHGQDNQLWKIFPLS